MCFSKQNQPDTAQNATKRVKMENASEEADCKSGLAVCEHLFQKCVSLVIENLKPRFSCVVTQGLKNALQPLLLWNYPFLFDLLASCVSLRNKNKFVDKLSFFHIAQYSQITTLHWNIAGCSVQFRSILNACVDGARGSLSIS